MSNFRTNGTKMHRRKLARHKKEKKWSGLYGKKREKNGVGYMVNKIVNVIFLRSGTHLYGIFWDVT